MTGSVLLQILIKFQNGFDRQQLMSDSEPVVRLGILSIGNLDVRFVPYEPFASNDSN
jgi:hypothetical protein